MAPLTKAQERLLARIFFAVHLRRAEELERQQDEIVTAEMAERLVPPARHSTREQKN
jgi:hypothetical protein